MEAPFSSLGRSVAAYAPNWPAPVQTQDEFIRGGYAGMGFLPSPSSTVSHGSPIVSRKPRRKTRYLYAHGSQRQSWFRMIATGQCESSKFQPYLSHMFDASFNDGLFEAGYPQNLGLSVKVGTIPNDLLNGTTGPTMNPAPNQRRVIFTRRAYSTAPSVPAKPAAS